MNLDSGLLQERCFQWIVSVARRPRGYQQYLIGYSIQDGILKLAGSRQHSDAFRLEPFSDLKLGVVRQLPALF